MIVVQPGIKVETHGREPVGVLRDADGQGPIPTGWRAEEE